MKDSETGKVVEPPKRDDPVTGEAPAMLNQASAATKGAGNAIPEKSQGIKLRCTDLGNARRLVAQHGQNLLYCPQLKTWLAWDDVRWIRDEDGEIFRRAKDVVRTIHIQAYQERNDAAREKLGKWAVQSEACARIVAMIKVAETESGIPVSASEFDANHFLFTFS